MSELNNSYQKIFEDVSNNIKDEKEKQFVLSKFQELSMMFIDVIDRITALTDSRVKEVEQKQKEIENKVSTVQKMVDNIENDIYDEDEAYEFEIACPYCNNEFITEISSDVNSEIECPECHNVIELDWNGDDEQQGGCSHGCSHCEPGNCLSDEELVYDEDDEIVEEKVDTTPVKEQKEQQKNKTQKHNKKQDTKQDEDEDM